MVEQKKKLTVAGIDLEAAEREATALRKRGKADADGAFHVAGHAQCRV